MKTINDYAIYCTEEQTKKALKLGAPINMHAFNAEFVKANKERFKNIVFVDEKCYCLPTAEEIIGWLEEQGLFVEPYFNGEVRYNFSGLISTLEDGELIQLEAKDSRKEATIAVIDAALDYLSNNKTANIK